MSLPEAKLTIQDGALGIVPSNGNNTAALVGTCSGGTPNTVYSFTDPTTLVSTLGQGPLVEAAAFILAVAGGPVVCCPATKSNGAAGSVTQTGTGLSVVSTTGNPNDAYDAKVKIVQGGTNPAAGTATMQVSLDGGRTYGPETAVPTGGSYAVPNTGLTLAFTAASLVAGDIYAFTSTAPSMTTNNFNSAVDALLGDPTPWFLLWAVGIPADSTAAGALFGALDSKLSSAETTYYRYARGLMSGPNDTDANLKTAFNSLTSTKVVVAAGLASITSAISGAQYSRSAAYAIAARAVQVTPDTSLGRVKDGPLKGVVALARDEFKTPGLDAARFATLRTIVSKPGFYITNARILSSPSSDYQYLETGRVMDIAATTVRQGELDYLNDSVRVNSTTGLILEADARSIEGRLESQMRATTTQPGYASDVSAQVDRTVNMLSTSQLVVRFRVTPKAYARTIVGTIALYNPALQPVAQAA
jgi:hypothetical protein